MALPEVDRPTLVTALPCGRFYPEGGEEVFRRLQGAVILRIGSPADGDVEGGGLAIEYEREGVAGLLILGFNELGMWVELDEVFAIAA